MTDAEVADFPTTFEEIVLLKIFKNFQGSTFFINRKNVKESIKR